MRLLVVDDEPAIGLTLRMLLEEHDVVVACSAREAQEALDEGAYDAVLCDLGLDDMDGAELARWVGEAHPAMAERIVMMSGGALDDAGDAALRALPPERRLNKPFSMAQIRAVLAPFAG